MRIHFFDQYSALGGGQKILLDVVHEAVQLGFEVHVHAPGGGLLEKAVGTTKATFHAIPSFPLRQGKKSFFDLVRLLLYTIRLFFTSDVQGKNTDLLYINGPRCLPFALLMQWLFGTRVVVHVHLDHSAIEKKLMALIFRQKTTCAMLVPSQYIYDQLCKFSPVFSNNCKLTLLKNGLGAAYDKLIFENRFGTHPFSVALPGRISPEKGQDILFSLAPRFPMLSFHVIGDAAFSETAYMDNLQSKLPDNVRFHGWVDDMPALLAQENVQMALIPSRANESFGLAAIECMASSCLTLVRNSGGLHEIVENCEALTFSSDAEAEEQFQHLLELPTDQLGDMAHRQYSLAQQHYSHTAFTQRIRDVLQNLNATIH